jgi:hypothetical protein
MSAAKSKKTPKSTPLPEGCSKEPDTKSPLNFPEDISTVLDALSLDGKPVCVSGTMSYRSQLYAADYDTSQVVSLNYADDMTAVRWAVKRFKAMVKHLQGMRGLYVGDIKGGEVEAWKVIPDTATVRDGRVWGYDADAARDKVRQLHEEGAIKTDEMATAMQLLIKHPTVKHFMEMRDIVRFHIVRWTPAEVAKGFVTLRTGVRYTLEEAFMSHGLTKVDVVAFVGGSRYADFSCIYTLQNKGKVLNAPPPDDIKLNLLALYTQGNFFKMAKRMFSMARRENKHKRIADFTAMMNSDLGRIYTVVADIELLLKLLEERKGDTDRIRYEADQMRSRLGNVSLGAAEQPKLLKLLKRAGITPQFGRLVKDLDEVRERLNELLQKEAKKELMNLGLFPPPKEYLP